MEGDQLPDKNRGGGLFRRPTGLEDVLLGADEADDETLLRQFGELGEEVRVRLRVGDDYICCA